MYNQTNNPLERFAPPITLNLIIINFIVWLASLVLPKFDIDLVNIFGLHFVGAETFKIYQPITYMFLHNTGSISHLFFNMFSLWMFGSVIERYIGNKKFLMLYFSSGIAAAFVQEVFWFFENSTLIEFPHMIVNLDNDKLIEAVNYLSIINTIGASGAVFGILLAYGMLFPDSKIYLYFLIPMRAKYFVILYGIVELFYGVSNSYSDVAHFAHLGGMLGALILLLIWRKKGKINNY